jgi:hypothetical protein
MKSVRFTLFPLVSLLIFAIAAYGQGFGGGVAKSKKKVSLHRKLPATVHLTGTSIGSKVTARDPKNNDVAGQLTEILQTELLKYDRNLRVERTRPDSLITCTITNFSMPPAETVTRDVLTEKKIGKDMRQIQEPRRYHRIKGSLDVTYQVTAQPSGATLDSDNIKAAYSEEFEDATGGAPSTSQKFFGGDTLKNSFKKLSGGKSQEQSAPTPSELQQLIVSRAASLIASRLVNTDETVEVMLARGKLDDANKMAEAGLWNRNLETLEQMPPLPNREDDAYRLYNIGVAYEALGYLAGEPKEAKTFFDQAAINYGKAVDAKPSEKYFLEPQMRIETALVHYRTLEKAPVSTAADNELPSETKEGSPTKEDSPAGKKATSRDVTGGATKATKKATPAPVSNASLREKVVSSPSSSSSAKVAGSDAPHLINDAVIKLLKAGMDEENLVSTIQEAPSTHFDMSVDGQLQLVNAGVKGKVLSAIRHKANPQPKRSTGSQNP